MNSVCVKKTRCERASGLLQDVCLAWLAMRRRQMNPAGPRAEPVGRQGPCPQRAAQRAPGSNAQALPSEAFRSVPMAGETEDVSPDSQMVIFGTRWAATSCKWVYNSYK